VAESGGKLEGARTGGTAVAKPEISEVINIAWGVRIDHAAWEVVR